MNLLLNFLDDITINYIIPHISTAKDLKEMMKINKKFYQNVKKYLRRMKAEYLHDIYCCMCLKKRTNYTEFYIFPGEITRIKAMIELRCFGDITNAQEKKLLCNTCLTTNIDNTHKNINFLIESKQLVYICDNFYLFIIKTGNNIYYQYILSFTPPVIFLEFLNS